MYYCGINIAKHRHEMSVLDEAGNSVLSMHFPNTQKGLEKLLDALSSLKIEPENVLFCMEATGHYLLTLYCQLKELGYQLHVINPIQSDALLLADLVRLSRTPSTEIASETALRLQTLSRLRLEFVHQIGVLKKQGIRDLEPYYPRVSGVLFQCLYPHFSRAA